MVFCWYGSIYRVWWVKGLEDQAMSNVAKSQECISNLYHIGVLNSMLEAKERAGMKKLWRKIKIFINGQCPVCGNTDLVHAKGWMRATCKRCGITFSYWVFSDEVSWCLSCEFWGVGGVGDGYNRQHLQLVSTAGGSIMGMAVCLLLKSAGLRLFGTLDITGTERILEIE